MPEDYFNSSFTENFGSRLPGEGGDFRSDPFSYYKDTAMYATNSELMQKIDDIKQRMTNFESRLDSRIYTLTRNIELYDRHSTLTSRYIDLQNTQITNLTGLVNTLTGKIDSLDAKIDKLVRDKESQSKPYTRPHRPNQEPRSQLPRKNFNRKYDTVYEESGDMVAPGVHRTRGYEPKAKKSENPYKPIDIPPAAPGINREPEVSFVIQMDEPIKPGGNTGAGSNPMNIFESLINILGSAGKDKKDTTSVESEAYDSDEAYDSNEEYEDLEIEINSIDDIIAIGEEYLKNIEDKKKKKEKKIEIVDADPETPKPEKSKKHKSGQLIPHQMMENNAMTFTNNTYTPPLFLLPAQKKEKTNDTKKKPDNFFRGKKYYIDFSKLGNLVAPLKKLKAMIGLEKIKKSILDMILYYLQDFEKGNRNMLHTVIEGPPGVGKTEFGKILSEVYAALGIIKSNKFKLVKRTDLIGEYLGHTAHKTQRVIDEADGGVLFIDEAYALGNEDKKDSYSKECIDTLNQNLSENKKKLIVIIAGYPNELERSFFSHNPGLKRRFPFRFSIDGYEPEEMKKIFIKMIGDSKWSVNNIDIQDEELLSFFTKNIQQFPHYGGDMENLLVECKFSHAKRIFGKHPKHRRKLTKDDLLIGFDRFVEFKKKNKDKDNEPPVGMYC